MSNVSKTAPLTPGQSAATSEAPNLAAHAEDGVSIIIPAYNEELGVAGVLTELLEYLRRLSDRGIPYEVLIVDDGSKDATATEIEPFIGEHLRLVRHERNRGYGASIKTGVRRARYPWIMITDADGTYPCEFIEPVLNEREGNDMVVGARVGHNSEIPLIRRPPKWVLRKLASYLSRREIPDLNSGLRVMRKDLVERYSNLLPDGFSLTTTITLALLSAGYCVKYTPINYRKRKGKSKIRPIADTLGFLVLIIRTITYFEPLRIFMPAALAFFLGSVAVGVCSILFTGAFMDVTTVLLFVTSIQLLAIGMMADVVTVRNR